MLTEIFPKSMPMDKFAIRRLLALTLILCMCSEPAISQAAVASKLAILEFELNDLTLNPDLTEKHRVLTLRQLLEDRLVNHHKHTVIPNPQSAQVEAAKGHGYLFDRPAIASRIGREAGVDWVVSGRLHKASFLFVYLKAQLINVQSGSVVADFVVEIKGPQMKLTLKGIETLAQQIHDALMVVSE